MRSFVLDSFVFLAHHIAAYDATPRTHTHALKNAHAHTQTHTRTRKLHAPLDMKIILENTKEGENGWGKCFFFFFLRHATLDGRRRQRVVWPRTATLAARPQHLDTASASFAPVRDGG